MALSSTLYCATCGAANRAQAVFCSACGRSLHKTARGSTSNTLIGLLVQQHILKQRYRILSRTLHNGRQTDIVFLLVMQVEPCAGIHTLRHWCDA